MTSQIQNALDLLSVAVTELTSRYFSYTTTSMLLGQEIEALIETFNDLHAAITNAVEDAETNDEADTDPDPFGIN